MKPQIWFGLAFSLVLAAAQPSPAQTPAPADTPAAAPDLGPRKDGEDGGYVTKVKMADGKEF